MSQHEPEFGQRDRATPFALQAFVKAAREQPLVATCVTAEAVAAGLAEHQRRSQARRTLLLSGAIAIAASVVAFGLLSPLLSARDTRTGEAIGLATPAQDQTSVTAERPTLASAIRLRSTASIVVRSPWSIVLGEGSHEIEVDDQGDGEGLLIELPRRKLELVAGSMSIDVAEHSEAVRLHTGVAAWIDEDGQRTSITVERIELGSDDPKDPLDPALDEGSGLASAVQLAREAEQLLAAGKRERAIEVYRSLVRKHPRASQTRAAILDLARLLRADGRKDEARCAYQLYLERWPTGSVRTEVASQLERLGDGPTCRGLKPS